MSTYTPNVPQAGQRISQTQPLINENFLSLDAAIKNDHVDITDVNAALRMLHTKISFPAAIADPVLGANAGIIFPDSIDGVMQNVLLNSAGFFELLGIKRITSPGTGIQADYIITNSSGPVGPLNREWNIKGFRLNCGFAINFGYVKCDNFSGGAGVNFPLAVNYTTAALSTQLTAKASVPSGTEIASDNTTSFNVKTTSGGSTTFYVFSIGD